jgi:hypothetical protein
MALPNTVIEGTLKPDGTLELDAKPNLAPGRVRVIVLPLVNPSPTKHGLVEVMDDIRANQMANGYQRRTLEQMQAEEKQRQEEDAAYEQRCEQLWSGALPPLA